MKKSSLKFFGTDGIRGPANAGPLDVQQILRLGEATAEVLARQQKRPARVGLGWDTRRSSPTLVAALTAGLSSGGAEVYRFGVIPTPAVSYLTRQYKLDAGVVVSASHNPAEDNGIKYFSAQGGKFPEAREAALEKKMLRTGRKHPRTGVQVGVVRDVYGEAAALYTQHLIDLFSGQRLAGLKVVADLAQGACCRTVPVVLGGLKISCHYLYDQPDGLNINHDCGSLHPRRAGRAVRRLKARAGLSFDGDGDRVMLTDENGSVVNGDRMLGILAVHYARQKRLPQRTVVATVMSNLGLELFLKRQGLRLLRTTVGDKYVAQALAKQGLVLGGEQSGHMLLPRLSPTGDGLLTALEVLSVMRETRQPLSRLAGGWQDFPQQLVNIYVKRRPDLMSLPGVQQEVKAAGRSLGDRGRVNLRYSGTENLARVMVEAETAGQVEHWSHRIGDAVQASIGSGKRRIATWLTCV